MARGPLYTPEQDHALKVLYREHRSDWEHHIGDYPILADRPINSIRYRIYMALGLADRKFQPAVVTKVKCRSWPCPGVILFHDDARAARDHGSPGFISRGITHSMSGCSARWTSEAA